MSLNAIRFKTIFVLDAQVQLKTFLIHAGLPTGDIVTNIMAMSCESDYNEPKWTNHLFFQNSFKSNNRIQVKNRIV